jgi:hypothetical protein
MPPPGRRTVPDSLDPLVDTLSNVVGILVIVVVLTQLQLGDALERVAEIDLLRTREERAQGLMPAEADALGLRRDALLRRTDEGVEDSILLAEEALAALLEIAPVAPGDESQSLDELRERLELSKLELNDERAALDKRGDYAGELQQVPKKMVARLPDPQVVQGKISWILVRNGRIYLVDREKLFDQGQRAIGRVLGEITRDRRIRRDEYKAVARYFRKRDVGAGSFRWHLKTEPDIRVELAWRSLDEGLEHPGLGAKRAMRSWLAERSPEIDFIRFHVWADSFEAYLEAREVVEAAGFRAGWQGYEVGDELDVPLSIGRPAPEVGPIQVD